MPPITLAVIGTGFFSQYHYEAWTRIPEVRLAALAYSSNAERAAKFAETYRIPEIYDDVERMIEEVQPDLLDIVSPPTTHLPLVELAVKHGIPAITQKPLADELDNAKRLVEVADRSGSMVVTHENWRFKPWFREARRLIEGGAIGDPYSIMFRMRPGDGQGPEAYLDRQPYFQKMPRFLIHETGIHMIDVFRFLFGEVTAVTARLRRLNSVIAGEDAGLVIFDFASGASGLYDGNRLADIEAENPRLTMGEMLIEGAGGQIRLDGGGDLHVRRKSGAFERHAYAWTNRGYSGDCVFALQRHVVDHMLSGSKLENPVGEYIQNVFIEQAIYTSNAEGRRISVADARMPATLSPTEYDNASR